MVMPGRQNPNTLGNGSDEGHTSVDGEEHVAGTMVDKDNVVHPTFGRNSCRPA